MRNKVINNRVSLKQIVIEKDFTQDEIARIRKRKRGKHVKPFRKHDG